MKLKKVLYGIEYLSEHPIFTRAHIDVARKSAEHRQAQKRELDAEPNQLRNKSAHKEICDMDRERKSEKKAVQRIEAVAPLHKLCNFLNKTHISSVFSQSADVVGAEVEVLHIRDYRRML